MQIDLTGQRYNRLLVIERAANYVSPTGKQQGRWCCLCDCGRTVFCTTGNLRKGDCQSCGCLGKEHRTSSITTHGQKHSRLYGVWCNMKNRCYNPKVRSYKDYGGRGITVCSGWQHDFKAFYDWAMQAGYDPDAAYGACTLDRINVNGNYEPQNCRWVDMKTQANNKRKMKGESYGS